MPLAKSSEPSPTLTQPVIPSAPTPTGTANYEWNGIPIDILRTFSIDNIGSVSSKDLEQIREITEWAKSKTADEPSIGNVLQKISEIRRQLGAPALNEKAYSKVWQYIKFSKIIDNAQKSRDSLRGSQWV